VAFAKDVGKDVGKDIGGRYFESATGVSIGDIQARVSGPSLGGFASMMMED
jgi:hypothetical protein